VQAGGVVPMHPAGGLTFDLGAPVQDFWRSISSVLYNPIADSISALSRASPTEPIEPAMPESGSASVNANSVY
jgi:hypothetical protein